jgi:hypothetical protein
MADLNLKLCVGDLRLNAKHRNFALGAGGNRMHRLCTPCVRVVHTKIGDQSC